MTQAAALGAGGLCSAWVNVGCSLVAGLCGFLALSVRGPRAELSAPLLEEEEERKPRLGPPALLLFALEAMPSMGPTLTNVEFWLLFARRPCAPPLLSLAAVGEGHGGGEREGDEELHHFGCVTWSRNRKKRTTGEFHAKRTPSAG